MNKLVSLSIVAGVILHLLAAYTSLAASTEQLENGIEVSQYFSVSANSTCGEGDTPTSFVTAGGDEVNCTRGDHEAAFILDGNLDTWWQSENNATPVAITFSLQQPALSLELVGLRLTMRSSAPLVLSVEVRERGVDDYVLTQVYVIDDTSGSCDQYNVPCSNYSVEGRNNRGDVMVLVCPLNSPVNAVEDVRIITYGYVDGLASYRTIVEADLYTNIARGYYARSLHHISTQGETGRYLATGDEVPVNSSRQDFPDFTGNGYAVLIVRDSVNPVIAQWVFPSLPQATRYHIVFHYINRDFSRRPPVTISQGGVVYSSRVTLLSNCGAPSCYSVLSNEFDLTQEEMVVAVSLSSVNILLDTVIAIPEEFYNATLARSLEQRERFVQDCDVTRPLNDPFCVQAATSLSIGFYSATYDCSCPSMVATSPVCQSYGGQCTCESPDDGFSELLGRQCDLCPLYSYQTSQGCTECQCAGPLDICDIQSGQCSNCPPLVGGLTCDSCVENSFGDPTIGCMPCSCNLTGTELCNQTTGECVCKVRVDGASCDQCDESSFNFTLSGCESCDCDFIGSTNQSCDDRGVCTCMPGVAGDKCTECLDGYFALSEVGCLPCNCSGRTNQCNIDPTSMNSDPRELCSCPPPYTGSSCDECFDGFFLLSLTGDCEECQCNSRAETCTSGSGDCIACTGNTTGDSCDVCLDGYYDNDPGSNLNCQPCPCSTNTSSNTSCEPDDSGNPVCFCLKGHEGQLCDSCSSGFFGDPPTFRCTSCDCSGNIDVSEPLSCDQQTGVCLLCNNNSTGNECERCISGFYGDATNQDCQSCDCFAGGSDGTLCDDITGQCSCLDGVNGQRCDQCLPGYWNFTSGVGCEPCVCSDGSVSSVCNIMTGECTCNPGVGGADCSTCLNGYFNFTADQCSLCNCGLGAVNSSCTPNEGRCYCQPGVTGDKCDQCQPFHNNLSPSGCEPCGECEQTLRNDLFDVADSAVTVATNISFFQTLYDSDINGFEEIEQLSVDINQNLSSTQTYLERVGGSLLTLNSSAVQVSAQVQATRSEIDYTIQQVIRVQPFAEEVHEHVLSISRAMDQLITGIAQIRLFLLQSEVSISNQATTSDTILQNILFVANLHSRNFTSEVIRAQELLTLAQGLSVSSDMLISNVLMQRDQADDLLIKINYILSNVSEIESLLSDSELRIDQVNSALDAVRMLSDQLESTVLEIVSTVELAETGLDTFDTTIANAQGALIVVRDDINTLDSLIGEVTDSSGELSMLSGSGSGLGMGLNIEATPTTVVEGVSTLRTVVEVVESETERCGSEVEGAQDYANMLVNVTNQINSTIFSSSIIGREAVTAIINYADSISMIEEAVNLTIATNQTIQDLNQLLDSLMVESLDSQSDQLLQSSLTLLSEAQGLADNVTGLLISVGGADDVVMVAENQSESADVMVQGLRREVMEFRQGAMMTSGVVERNLTMTDSNLGTVGRLHTEISEDVPVLVNDATESMDVIADIQITYTAADSLLESANSTALVAREAVVNRNSSLTSIRTTADFNDQQLDDVATSITDLMNELQQAMEAAASIDAALRFYGDSTLSYSLPPSLSPSSTASISMVFRPSDVSQGTMLVSDVGMGQEGVALRLDSGAVQFEYSSNQSDVIQTDPGILREEEWYQLYATLDSSTASLSVASLRGNGSTYSTTSSAAPLSQVTTVHLGGTVLQEEERSGGVVPVIGGFVGCLDRVIFNNMQLSLFLPNDVGNSIETCGPRPPSELSRSFVGAAWFQGAQSFIQLLSAETISPSTGSVQLDFSFRTLTANGTLLYLSNMDDSQYLIVYLTNGALYLEYSLVTLDRTIIGTNSSYSDGQSYNVSVSLEGQNASLVIGDEVIQGSTPRFASRSFVPSGQFFIGRVPSAVNDGIWPESFAGCMDGLQVNGVSVDLQDRQTQVNNFRVSLEGCPAQVVSGVRFMGEGLAVFESVRDEDVANISLTFRGSQLAALLLQVDNEPRLSMSIYHTRLRVDYAGTVLLSSNSDLNNNRQHSVFLGFEQTNHSTRLTLIVDGETSEAVTVLTSEPNPVLLGNQLYVGGAVDSSISMVTESFRGCIDNVNINGRTLDFNNAIKLVGVSLYGCRPSSLIIPVPPPPPPLPPPPSQRPNITIGLNGEGSFIALRVSEDEIIDGYSIVLEFQTVSQDALLVYTQGSIHTKDFMALQLVEGQLVYSFDLGTGRVDISSDQTYNDGIIHTVELRRRGQLGEMIINGGVESQSASSPGRFSSLNINSGFLFVGGVADMNKPITLQQPGDDMVVSAVACIHSFSINGVYENLSNPQALDGVGSCLNRYSNAATFNTGSYVELFDRFSVGVKFGVSFEFRTSRCSGVLLYVASPFYPDHLLLELVDGTLRFVFDNGPLEEEVAYVPPDNSSQLCDGQFHTLTVTKDGVIGSIIVDGVATVVTSRFGSFIAVNTNDPLFIGGLPATERQRFTVTADGSFQGCIRDLSLSEDSVEFKQVLLSDAMDFSNVDMNICRS